MLFYFWICLSFTSCHELSHNVGISLQLVGVILDPLRRGALRGEFLRFLWLLVEYVDEVFVVRGDEEALRCRAEVWLHLLLLDVLRVLHSLLQNIDEFQLLLGVLLVSHMLGRLRLFGLGVLLFFVVRPCGGFFCVFFRLLPPELRELFLE